MNLIILLFALLVAYQLKHFLADYIFQGEYQLGKFKADWGFFLPLLSHVAFHFVGTFLIVAATLAYYVVPYAFAYALLIGLFDATVHFFMDRIKAGPKYMGRWKPLSAVDYVQIKQALAGADGGGAGSQDFRNQALLRQRLRGNKYFWWALGFDQMVHHFTHYVCILAILAVLL